jgi:hypothetical protein
MNLSYSLSRTERGIAPLPHLIAVNGPRARKVLSGSGFDPESIFIAGTFRYPASWPRRAAPSREDVATILVALAAGIDESLELALKSVEALGGSAGTRLILKCHPSVAPASLVPHLSPLPPDVSVSSAPIGDLLGKTDLVLYSSSTVAVEAAARGIPVVHVRSDLIIDRNIFEGEPGVPSCSTPEELMNTVTGLVSRLRAGEAVPLPDIGEIFSPVVEENIGRFLGNE